MAQKKKVEGRYIVAPDGSKILVDDYGPIQQPHYRAGKFYPQGTILRNYPVEEASKTWKKYRPEPLNVGVDVTAAEAKPEFDPVVAVSPEQQEAQERKAENDAYAAAEPVGGDTLAELQRTRAVKPQGA